jgi:transcriptional regulator with XRE-family HTH domain
MSDKEIISTIANNIEKTRVSKNITSKDLAQKGGYNKQTYTNFVNKGTNIKLDTVIGILRGLDKLDALQNLFEYKEVYSPIQESLQKPQRVRASTKKQKQSNSIFSKRKIDE